MNTEQAIPIAPLEDTALISARKKLLPFTLYTNHSYEVNWHHKLIASALDRVLNGTCRRLMILMPPQTGKSEIVSRRFPPFAFGCKPNLKILEWSYSDALAQSMSRDVQRIMSTPEYRAIFPNIRLGDSGDLEKRTQGEFDIVGGRGSYLAAGVMGSVTGKTVNIGIVDDPIKNRAEAESEVYRDRVWAQYQSAFATRQFGDSGSIIICMTPWHQDDLAHRLLSLAADNPDADQWEVLRFPAIAEVTDRYRRSGEALWPSKYPLDELRRRRAGMGEYDWAALYQQRPTPSGGGLFKEEWFANKFVDASPVNARRARGWDTAATKNGGDYTVGVKVAEAGGIFFIEDVVRGQWTPGEVDKRIRVTAELDGVHCAQREEQEGGSAGKAVIEARVKALAGFNYEGVSVTGSKVVRSKPFRVQCEAGNVRIVRGPWNRDYITELCGFPSAKHDDQVDATSCAFNAVLLEPPAFDYAAVGMTSVATW